RRKAVLAMRARSEDLAPPSHKTAGAYLIPVIFSTAAWEFFRASSGVIVPATALESSMPNAFSISGHLGWRGRGVEKLIAFMSVGKWRNLSCAVSSGSVNTENRTGGLPRVAEILICAGGVAHTL